MSWAAAIVGGSAVVGGGLSYLSQRNSTSSAQGQSNKAIKFQKKQYKDYKQDMKPYTSIGKEGLGLLQDAGKSDMLQSRDIMEQLKQFGQGFDISGEFDPNDPTYTFKKEQQEKGINQYLASRGLYNSRPGLNLLDQSNRALIADESDKQYGRNVQDYNRGYGNLMDLFNMSSKFGEIDYGRALDMIKIGRDSTQNLGNAGIATGGMVAQGYGQKAGLDLLQGRNQSDFWSGMGAQPLNFTVLKEMFGGNAPSSNVAGYSSGIGGAKTWPA